MRKILVAALLMLTLNAAAATPIWIGNATSVAQVGTFVITAYDVTTTYKITIGGITVSQIGTGGTTATTAAALNAALVASTHPYFTAITWSVSSSTITATAVTAGVPFTATSSIATGTGTIAAYSATTANSGPCDWLTATNWSTGAAPVTGDDVVISDCAANISYSLNQSGVLLNSLRVQQSFTGKLGLNRSVFTTSADGATNNTAYTEYRPLYLQVGLQGTALVVIGENFSTSGTVLAGSTRVMVDLGSSAGTVEVQNTATASSETSRPAVRIKCNSATLNVFIRTAPGGFGVAIDQVGETSTLGKMSITDKTGVSKVLTGLGTVITTWEQYSGTNILQGTGTVTTINLKSGTLQTEGTFAATTCNMYTGCTFNSNSTGTITTLNLYGGTANFTLSNRARTVTTMAFQAGSSASFTADNSVLTITGFTTPSTRYTLTAR